MRANHAAWADHALQVCVKNASVRTKVHDELLKVWVMLLKSAGFQDIRLEDRSFDAAATGTDVEHRRPDIVCTWGGVRYILDITIAWASDVGAAEWRPVAYDADEKGKGKDRAYQAAMRREAEGGEGWFESMRCARTDHFVPLAYESNGEWGTRAKEFFKLVCEIAGTEGTRSADCYHWSAMTYGRHWRHRVAVILGRGRVTCLRRSADKGFGGSDVFTAEVAPDSL